MFPYVRHLVSSQIDRLDPALKSFAFLELKCSGVSRRVSDITDFLKNVVKCEVETEKNVENI